MSYFNIFHIIVLILILSMFGLFTYLIILKEHRTKQAISLLIVNVAIMSCLAMVSMMLIDKYTKVAEIINLEGRRTLINETISYSGIIKNVGYGDINSCVIEIEMINSPANQLKASDFEDRGFFDRYIGSAHDSKGIQKGEFLIVKDLLQGEHKSFSFSMPYPAHFQNHSINYTLNCK